MSKKKIRKPKKSAPLKARSQDNINSLESPRYRENVFIYNDEGERINLTALVENMNRLTDPQDLITLYEALNDPECPYFNPLKAESLIKKLRKYKDSKAHAFYGEYLMNHGRDQEALPYLRKAAAAMEPDCLFYLGLFYQHAHKIAEATKYYEKASEYNAPSASFNAYINHFNDTEVHDDQKAQYYLTKAFEQGHPKAVTLAWEYCFNHPLDHQDDAIGLAALKKMIAQKEEKLFYRFAITYVKMDISDVDVFALLQSLNVNHWLYHQLLGDCYMFGLGTKPDINKAITYYQSLENSQMYKTFIRLVDPQDPFNSLLKKAKQGNKSACYFVGRMYEHGAYVNQDMDLAIRYLKKGISTKYLETGYELAHIYLRDQDHQKIHEAISILDQPLKVMAQFTIYLTKFKDLYHIYHDGIGVKVDEEKAQNQINHLALLGLLP